MSLLFPDEPRSFPGRRSLRTGLRAAHIFTSGVLLGGHVFDVARELLWPYLIATIVTGGLLILMDLYASFAMALEVRGAILLLKIAALLLVPVLWDARVGLLAIALLIGVVGSHMPGRFRHRLLWLRGRVAVDERKG